MSGVDARPLSWPSHDAVYVTLDLECDYGTALDTNTYEALDAVPRLVSVLEQYDVPLTCFVQTEVLDERPTVVDTLRDAAVPISFHAHSHSHRPRAQTDMPTEVRRATNRFESFFGCQPAGYRVPNGHIESPDYRSLADHGYAFDASVFPTRRPGLFDNSDRPRCPTYLPGVDLFELPFTVLSPYVPIPTALSYHRVLGRPFGFVQRHFRPRPTVFNVHMHDLVTPDRFADLPRRYRFVYGRNDRGFSLFEQTLAEWRRRDLEFGRLDDVVDALQSRDRGRQESA